MARFTDEVPVAVRSSATAEDLPDASFAGQQDTYLWLTRCRDASASTCAAAGPRSTPAAPSSTGCATASPNDDLSMAVAVQKMVNARASGVAMTMDPSNGDRSKIVIDASWGVGEMVVSGPGHARQPAARQGDALDRRASTSATSTPSSSPTPPAARSSSARSSPSAAACAASPTTRSRPSPTMAKRAEKHYGCPQDIEWALDADLPDGENLLLLQSRPETVALRRRESPTTSTPHRPRDRPALHVRSSPRPSPAAESSAPTRHRPERTRMTDQQTDEVLPQALTSIRCRPAPRAGRSSTRTTSSSRQPPRRRGREVLVLRQPALADGLQAVRDDRRRVRGQVPRAVQHPPPADPAGQRHRVQASTSATSTCRPVAVDPRSRSRPACRSSSGAPATTSRTGTAC